MNYISVAIYVLFIVSLVIGIQKAPRAQIKKDSLSLDAMTSLKGVMALCVLLHHISQKALFQQTKTIPFFEHIGFLFVGIFFFCSGYGLYKSLLTKENYLDGFLKKRVLPIVISYYVMILIYSVYYLLIGQQLTNQIFSITQWILKLSGIILINSQSWYVYVILIMYISFYFIFKNEKTRKYGIVLLLIITLMQGALYICLNHFPWYIGETDWWKSPTAFINAPWWKRPCALPFEGEWWVNSTIGFVIGIFIAQKEKKIFDFIDKKYVFAFIISLVACAVSMTIGFYALFNISYWTDMAGNLGFVEKSICYIAQNLQVICLIFFVIILMRKGYVKNKFYSFLGKMSLELYLIQETCLLSWSFLIEKGRTPIFKSNNYNTILYFLCVLISVLASAIIYKAINVLLTKKIKSK